jgi:hypothetical protein
MADKYRIAQDGSDFVVNYEAGGTVGVYETEQAAKQEIEVCERDDFMLQTAKSLVKAAVEAHMWLHNTSAISTVFVTSGVDGYSASGAIQVLLYYV